ncbi:sulfurtransferase complex subunit TusB [Shewanella gaetbuli]|uniref:Sulfurtransferase complex subunit TusB n=1 Tax=Shewanella gaetbuli TaxID=220752 RepID=A0A9X2CMY4_9GAMM|nr:sulfurtransferase complex subunit TusB [Shewanella gaetbuli]MCL1144155.1 sulfurtransferase complex subunit TusB [Shewanella gaetbuli]
MILHHVQTSALNDNALAVCLRFCAPQDSIVLSSDAVIALLDQQWLNKLKPFNIMALADDVAARGLTEKHLAASSIAINLISMNEFVAQSLTHQKVITW